MRPASGSFEEYAAERLLHQHVDLTRIWLERLSAELHVRPRRVPPADDLLTVMPVVLRCVAEFVRSDQKQAPRLREAVVEPLSSLARLRQSQGCDPQELIREFDLLAQVLDAAGQEWLGTYPDVPSPESVVRVAGRLNRAPILMGEISIGAYWESGAAERSLAARQLREFADVLVHELNTPLGAAEGAALLLENDEMVASSQERRRFAGLIQRNLRRARLVISDVCDLVLAHAPPAQQGRWLPMERVVGEVLAEMQHAARESGVRIEVAEPVPDFVVDAARLEIILLNLVGNAVKYADPARMVRWVRIGFERRGAEGGCWVSVSDNGLGIPAEQHERIFQRFFRAHPDRAEGTGLGLAIVRDAVRQLGGEIEFESEPGVGSTFRFLLPPAPQDQRA